MAMHEGEYRLTEEEVAALIAQQHPSFSHLAVSLYSDTGTDNQIFRLGDEFLIRLPRIASSANQIEKEQQWLPIIASYVPCMIPEVLASGSSTENYPFPWSIYHWIEGATLADEIPDDLELLAYDLAAFIQALWKVPTDDAPKTRRGKPLAPQDDAVQKAIKALKGRVEIEPLRPIWQQCLGASPWEREPVWLHADLLPSNIVVQDGRLHGVIDFGLSGIGDPACDLIVAWSVLDVSSRRIFREALAIDDDTWLRGKGWALSIALIILPYYWETNPVLVGSAHAILKQILLDEE